MWLILYIYHHRCNNFLFFHSQLSLVPAHIFYSHLKRNIPSLKKIQKVLLSMSFFSDFTKLDILTFLKLYGIFCLSRQLLVNFPSNASFNTACLYLFNFAFVSYSVSTALSKFENNSSIRATICFCSSIVGTTNFDSFNIFAFKCGVPVPFFFVFNNKYLLSIKYFKYSVVKPSASILMD